MRSIKYIKAKPNSNIIYINFSSLTIVNGRHYKIFCVNGKYGIQV